MGALRLWLWLSIGVSACASDDPSIDDDRDSGTADVVDAAAVFDAGPGRIDADLPANEIVVPAGSFVMGCSGGEVDCRFDELPARTVSLSAYAIDRLETTQAEWAACLAAGACPAPQANFTPAVTPDAPVRDVTWAQAAAYCSWRGWRLPSEAEWERAARGDQAFLYPWGSEAPDCSLAAHAGCPGAYQVGTHAAGASPFGVEDMAGGVRELVADYYQPGYADLPASDPRGPSRGSQRVMRGGSFASEAWTLRARSRAVVDPALVYDDVGLRCARSLR